MVIMFFPIVAVSIVIIVPFIIIARSRPSQSDFRALYFVGEKFRGGNDVAVVTLMLIALSVVNALAHADYHPKADYWDGVGLVTILFVNIVFVCMAWFFESTKVMSEECSRIILYDNVNLVSPEKREELKADLEKRTGLKIKRIEIGLLDYLKDSALIRIFYDNPEEVGNSIARFGRMPKEI